MTGPLRGLRLFTAALALLAAGCAVAPGGAEVRLAQVARVVPGDGPRWQQAEPEEVGLRVVRGGRAIPARRGMTLQPGDEVDTGAAAAVLAFRGSGEVVVDERSRVRVGSLEVLFGRIFASVRGFFQASSENVVAGVEGTRFLFEVRRDRAVRVAVADGVVSCRARNDAWPPVPLHAGRSLFSAYPNREPPRVEPADRQELAEAERRLREVSDAPAAGWCCVGGRLEPGWSNRCGGAFSTRPEVARALCRPPPAPPAPPTPPAPPAPDRRYPGTESLRGWCCQDGQVVPSLRGQCAGSWHATAEAARQACRPVIR